MKFCHCILGGTKACLTCSNNCMQTARAIEFILPSTKKRQTRQEWLTKDGTFETIKKLLNADNRDKQEDIINLHTKKQQEILKEMEEREKEFLKLINKPAGECMEENNETKKECKCSEKAEGFKDDAGKPALSLVPPAAKAAIAKIMEYGMTKYGKDTWQTVSPRRYLDAALRHLDAIQDDWDAKDEESGLPHTFHALCNLAYIVAITENAKTDKK